MEGRKKDGRKKEGRKENLNVGPLWFSFVFPEEGRKEGRKE